ncbi:aldehyde dehydrogenase [Gordoniibacillus kamchatkensis]|uniref:Aldehyde dehydrogenase n=1 Tax=Gordoniibacillus kamchatkensis TaxID=1590651 RepID=A0ABR5AJW7_9BACL|nr:aldehyde dehydrogenase [Paenibacillus sp. VKM B-2647]KIL41271.1 aldehyde dehydrogenase [Paenibacillus sp. VKM B-2647]
MNIHIPELVSKQRQYFQSGRTLDAEFRLAMLRKLREALRGAEPKLRRALHADLGKSEAEAYMSELGPTLAELSHAIRSLPKWAKPRKVRTPVALIGSRGFIMPEPYGSALIIAPWNYPVFLSLPPLIGAIAAGNCAVLKPSELAPHTSQALRELIGGTFPESYVAVVEGEANVSQALLREKFDYVFFTGSTAIGKKVLEAAAAHLTPATLELGGKSPCIVHGDADIGLAARRIAWGKTLNAGQTCVAPDYVLVQRGIKRHFLDALRTEVERQSRNAAGDAPPRIVNERHLRRLAALLEGQDQRIVCGGRYDAQRLSFEPTLLDEPDPASPVMQEEIFGPIMPVLAYDELEDALRFVRERPKPLALYVFTSSRGVERETLGRLSFGGGCVNDTVLHLSSPYLPFGGVGASGIGSYHGQASFETFSHHKSVLRQTTRFDLPFRYAPGKRTLRLLRRLFK